LTFPEEGTGYEIGGMAIVKGAKNMQAAKLWFDWALTPKHRLWARICCLPGANCRGVELSHPELMQVNLIDYDFIWAGTNKKAFVDRFINEIASADDLKRKTPILGSGWLFNATQNLLYWRKYEAGLLIRNPQFDLFRNYSKIS
jgi:spermidine/putrescine-binding protein